MKPFYNNFRPLIAICIFAIISFLNANKLNAQTNIDAIGTSYTQNFNTLTTAGSWTDNSTLANWYVLDQNFTIPTTFILNDGEISTDGLTSFGTVSDTDRSLGYAPLGSGSGITYVGWRFKNTTANPITSLEVKWAGEQWRDEVGFSQFVTLNYAISGSEITGIPAESEIDNVSGSSFVTLQNTGNSIKLDGNLSENRVSYTHIISTPIPSGSEIIIIWAFSDLGVNHLMAIDDISVTAKAAQTINFLPTGVITKNYGDASFSLTATATSGLPVTYSSNDPAIASISGSTVTINGPGVVTITASQSGNSYYLTANDATKTLNVNPKIPSVIEATNISPTSFQANWTADNGSRDGSTTYLIQWANNSNFTSNTQRNSTTKYYNISFTGPQGNTVALVPNSIYYYKVYAINGGRISAFSQASAITTGSNYRSNGDGEWTNPNNWTINTGGNNWIVSATNAIANSIEILHNTTINSGGPITTNTLFISKTAKLTTNQQINVTNNLIIEVGSNGVAGQILNTGNITVGENTKITIRKTFTAGQWNFMGFPFNVVASDITNNTTGEAVVWGNLNSGAELVVQQYNGDLRAAAGTAEIVNQGLHWGNVSPKVFTAKRGYIIYTPSSGVIDFSARGSSIGSFFSTSGASVSVGRYVSSVGVGHSYWNLICSPLSSKFNLGSTSPGTTYYAYNGVNYMPALTGEHLDIQPFASFFLQAPATSISFANAGRKVISMSANETAPEIDEVYLKLSNGNSTYDDLTRIRLQEGAAMDYEIGTDAVKMFGMDTNVSYIYSTINGTGAAINTLPNTVKSIELQTKFAIAGTYSITLTDMEKIKNYAAVILTDKVTGKNTDLLAVGSYTYTASAPGLVNRFKIQLAPKITTNSFTTNDNNIQIISKSNSAVISGINDGARLNIFDLNAKLVFSGNVVDNQEIPLQKKALYLFDITTKDKSVQIKSFIK